MMSFYLRSHTGGQPSVYFVCSGEEIEYIGFTSRPKCRLQEHKRSARFSGRRFYIQLHDDIRSAQKSEKLLIDRIRPSRNVKTYRKEYF